MYSQIDSNKRKTVILIAGFCAFIVGIGYVLNAYAGYDYSVVVLAVVISSFMSLLSYFVSDKIALASTGAKQITSTDNPYVYRMVENLSITQGLPIPKIYIIQSPALNAFATGRDPKHASIALTSGIIAALENEELEGVIAHELSHVKNYDIRVMTIVVVLVGAIGLIADFVFRGRLLGLGGDGDRKGGHPILIVIGIVALIISPIVAQLIQLAISRKREYLADASGALLTRYPEGLARALEKIRNSNTPLPRASSATAHLFISNPFKTGNIKSLFSTHPPIDDRIKKLREMTS